MSTIPTPTAAVMIGDTIEVLHHPGTRGRPGIDGEIASRCRSLQMSLTSLVWLFIAASIAVSALFAFSPQLDTARPAFLLRSSWRFGRDRRGTAGTLMVSAAVFLLVAGIGGAASYYLGDAPAAVG